MNQANANTSLTARHAALSALNDRAGQVTTHLNRLLTENVLPPQEAALARELALGVVRRQATLDAVISAFLTKPGQKIPPAIRQILRLGLYQLLMLEAIPEFAAVNETVGLVFGRLAYMKGFVNGLLRTVGRAVSPPQKGPPPLARDVLPVEWQTFRRFDCQVFPDPAGDPAAYLSAAFSLPPELAAKWLAYHGSLEKVIPLAYHANARPPLILRVNQDRASVAQVLDKLAAACVAAVAHANGRSVVLPGGADPLILYVFQTGLARPQDATASAVIDSADIRPGMSLLDLCSAPGTKTVQMALRLAGQGRVVAVDVSPEKLAKVQENCGHMGISLVETMQAEEVATLPPESFDLVLVDAPCSNTGVLARRVEARWRFALAGVTALARDQRHLLELGARFVKPGGQLVYSTCSLERQENALVVDEFLFRHKDFQAVRQELTLPSGFDDPNRWRDGGFLAVLRR